MNIVEPSYEIISCPDGEECLAKLERIARVAYKSEDKIDDGWRSKMCEACEGRGFTGFGPGPETHCSKCGGGGHIQFREEPSSHKLIRSILKADRREQLKARAREVFNSVGGSRTLMTVDNIVDMVVDSLRDDPPHESVIEHESITVLFTSNRGFTHELVRHRLAAFTQESTRYCNYFKSRFGEEITLCPERDQDLLPDALTKDQDEAIGSWVRGVQAAEYAYMELVKRGSSPQIARDLLPQVLKADIVITANLREWRHIFRLRCSPKAHPDMRKLMIPLRDELRGRIPIIFDEV